MRSLNRSDPMRQALHSVFRYYLHSFPIDRGKDRVLRALWKPLSFGEYDRIARLRLGGVRLRCDTQQFLQRQLYFRGSYEEEHCRLWMRYVRSARTVFDVGANVGLYSLLASWSNPKAEIHAFEPTPDIYQKLKHNIALNRMPSITANQLGVSGRSGAAYLSLCRGNDGSNEGMNYVVGRPDSLETTPIEVVSIDDYCRSRNIKSIDLMKLDIEGGEYDALCGACGLLQKKAIGCLFVELMGWAAERSGHTTFDIKRLLLDAGYSLYKVRSMRLVPITLEGDHDGLNIIACADPI